MQACIIHDDDNNDVHRYMFNFLETMNVGMHVQLYTFKSWIIPVMETQDYVSAED